MISPSCLKLPGGKAELYVSLITFCSGDGGFVY